MGFTVGIQGVAASFHEVAARKYFAALELSLIECPSFKILAENLKSKKADYCMMAIENSIAGSILPNYSILESYGFKIIGEVYLPIQMCLMALPGQTIEQLQFIQSHPMAIAQCEEFLLNCPKARVLEANDTAESAKNIKEKNLSGYGAIASELASKVYNLPILAHGIETNKQNYTRFLCVCHSDNYLLDPKANKSSIRFEAAHRPGSLVEVLEEFGKNSVNMTKIQSVPILGRPYQYSFHVDLEWSNHKIFQKTMNDIQDRITNLIHFGDYPRGERPLPC